MKKANFSTAQVEKLLPSAEDWLDAKKHYKTSLDLSGEIIKIKETAFESDDLLRRIIGAMQDPKKSNLIVGNIIRNIGSYDTQTSLRSLLTGNVVFSSDSVGDIVNLGIAAFERGDYVSALERAKQARSLLILERKGNFFLFLYLYWPFVLVAIFFISGIGVSGWRKYQRESLTKRIVELNKQEDSIRAIMLENQKKYFSKIIGAWEYHSTLSQQQEELAKVKGLREKLGHMRVKMVMPEQLSQDLESEKDEAEENIKKIQEDFYKSRQMPESEYRTQFNAFNERLAEIEEEKTTLDLLEKKEKKPELSKAINKPGILSRMAGFFGDRKIKKEQALKEKIDKLVEEKKGESLFT